jgi:hypothetical protein
VENCVSKDEKLQAHFSFGAIMANRLLCGRPFQAASGDRIVTMDADLQDDPEEIPRLLNKLDEGYDLVSGWKKKTAMIP